MVEFDPSVKRIEVHIILGCADSRDLSEEFLRALKEVKSEMMEAGVLIDSQRHAVAGTFITPEIVGELKTLIFQKMGEYFEYRRAGVGIAFFVHINAHGAAFLKEGADRYQHSVHNIKIDYEAKTNCGMMGASVVAKEIEQLLLKEKPTVGGVAIRQEEDIQTLLKNHYGFDGSVESWLPPIKDLAVHPLKQKDELRRNFNNDPVVRSLRVHITAGVQNYETNEYLRVDANVQPYMRVTFPDRVYGKVRQNGTPCDHLGRTAPQTPVLGLIHQTSIHDARKTAYEMITGEQHGAGKVFGMGIGDKTAIQDFRPFDRYQIAGLFYGIVHLGIKEWVVMGKSSKETDMMAERLRRDPLMSFFIAHYNVKITPISLESAIGKLVAVDFRQSFPHPNNSTGPTQSNRTRLSH